VDGFICGQGAPLFVKQKVWGNPIRRKGEGYFPRALAQGGAPLKARR
jgi:hypothetical protein